MPHNKIVLIIAHQGYQALEYSVTQQMAQEAGILVTTASNESGDACAHDGSTTSVDITLEEINVADYAGIFFIGGPGALEHLDNERSYKLIHEAIAQRKVIGGICIAPRILAHAGILKGKRATGWNGDDELEQVLNEAGALYTPKDVVIDSLIITAAGLKNAREFGQAILKLLPLH